MENANAMPGRLLTLETLHAKDACSDYRTQFARLFGRDITVTVALAEEQAASWDWEWAAEYLLTTEGFHAFNEVNGAATGNYRATMRPAWDSLERVTDEGWAASSEVKRLYRAANPGATRLPEEVWAEADAAFNAVVGEERRRVDQFDKEERVKLFTVRARTFAELYIKEGSTGE